MLPHKLTCLLFLILALQSTAFAQNRKPPAGGRLAIVVDERLAALRATPQLTGKLLRRLGRGRMLAIRSAKTGADGVTFFLVNVTSRTHGWIQREAVVAPSRAGDDRRLFTLIERSQGFDRISRARIFLDHFTRSSLRPKILLLLGDAAAEISVKLSKDAARRLNGSTGDAPEFSYYLNHTGLDRYSRLRVHFIFNQTTKRLHYDGAAWRELIRRHPKTPEALEAQKRLTGLQDSQDEHDFINPENHEILSKKDPSAQNSPRRLAVSHLNCQKLPHGLLIMPRYPRLSGGRRRRTSCRQH